MYCKWKHLIHIILFVKVYSNSAILKHLNRSEADIMQGEKQKAGRKEALKWKEAFPYYDAKYHLALIRIF